MTDPLAQPAPAAACRYEPAPILGEIYDRGITAVKGAFDRPWVERLAADVERLFQEALARPGGSVGRGPNRHYVEIQPERLSGFVDLVTHPWVEAVSEAVLGSDWRVVEVGFDVPLPGAQDQPWHRDFVASDLTRRRHVVEALAFNVTTVDVFDDMGPFEIAPGTQWDEDDAFAHGMFPPPELYPRYEARAERKLPQMGDISARTPLTIHRGTRNRSLKARPVLVLGVVPAEACSAEDHILELSEGYWQGLPERLRERLFCRRVATLEPLAQHHSIEGLVMGAA